MKGSVTERALSPRHVRYLKGRIEDGYAVPFNWAIANMGGKEYRANGQHSSAALWECHQNGGIPTGLQAHVDTYDVKSQYGLVELFRQFDSRIATRTPLEVAQAYMAIEEGLDTVDAKTATLGLRGVLWFLRKIAGVKDLPKGDDIGERFSERELHPFIKAYVALVTPKTPELKLPPVAAAMYGTYTTSPDVWSEFWLGVANNNGSETAPAQVLCETYMPIIKKEVKEKPLAIYGKSIKAWNAYRRGETITKLRVNLDKDLPAIAA